MKSPPVASFPSSTTFTTRLGSWAVALLDVLHPPGCAACGELLEPVDPPESDPDRLPVCTTCFDTLEPVDDPCRRCGEPDSTAGVCASCLAWDPPFAGAVARWRYGAAIADVLQRFKYGDRPDLARPLARALAGAGLPQVDVVTPVPLHWRRRLSRGYDQALLLASALARAAALPFDRAMLVRVRATSRQVGASRVARASNVDGAFAPGKSLGRWSGARVLLVDDVVTTGATAAACAEVLLRGGVESVHVASVARAG